MATMNIEIEIPDVNVNEMDELRRKLTAYAIKLVSKTEKHSTAKPKKYNHESLAGIFADVHEVHDGDDLRDGYINEKYGK